ncbi:hypothetical protein [Candidatus Proelusimicrobium excrementi]|uniref:hypothetical protein n=1 Tax=Candidatus Proelusimicrobium excrementi TaxID=3416222 RepID=UPI003CAB0279|nr:hypothetical protein [Elusimicrobiaceae bacterium]
MAVLLVLVVVGIIVAVCVAQSTNNGTSGHSSSGSVLGTQGVQKAHAHLNSVSPAIREKMQAAKQLLVTILINNLRCLPKDVLTMEYTQKAINAFVFYYGTSILTQQLTELEQVFTVMTLTFEELHNKGVIDINSIDLHINRDPRFQTMPTMLGVMSHFPPEKQTMLLVYIEKYMQAQKGVERVRYIGQRPTDNPLNSQEE